MDKFDVGGMSCAACSAAVEKAVSGVEGVTSCTVNLLTGSMGVADGQKTRHKTTKATKNRSELLPRGLFHP